MQQDAENLVRRKRARTEADLDRAEVIRSRGTGPTFSELLQRRISRRGVIKAGAAAGALAVTGPVLRPGKVNIVSAETHQGEMRTQMITFQPIAPQPADAQQVMVAEGHDWAPLLKWGDPIRRGAPAFDPDNLTAEAQEQQFGYNCDYIGFLMRPDRTETDPVSGVLVVNNEYTNGHLMFEGYVEGLPTKEQADIEMAAHGMSIASIFRDQHGRMIHNIDSELNRRITANTSMVISGPALGHDWMKTNSDPYGSVVLGTLNNCAGGKTPWGTVLSGEENFQGYFGNLVSLDPEDPRYDVHDRYGVETEGSFYGWEQYYDRFNVAVEPNEPFRFGWVVEIDPWDPNSMPVKRTALGRFRHEGATFGHSPSGRVVFYTGDDERFEYAYKYISDNAWDQTKRGMGQGLLDDGVLYVAKFNEDGTGEWMPLVYGEGPLNEENGFSDQGDVLIKTRMAADLLGATRMDRPEDFEQNPTNNKVYLNLTNNTRRTEEEVDAANPRAENAFGHVIEITEAGDDAAALTFTWDMFLLCGNPEDESTYFAGFPKDQVSPIANPDNIAFDGDGVIWISTDGQPGSLELADALHAVPTSGPQRGMVSQFLSVVAGAECSGPEFTNDFKTLFVAVQHPGEDGTLEEPQTTWPDGHRKPRPTVIQVWNSSGGRIGGGW